MKEGKDDSKVTPHQANGANGQGRVRFRLRWILSCLPWMAIILLILIVALILIKDQVAAVIHWTIAGFGGTEGGSGHSPGIGEGQGPVAVPDPHDISENDWGHEAARTPVAAPDLRDIDEER